MKDAGFSLIELLVAIAIVASSVAALARLFAVSTDANRTARAASTALAIAQQKIEALRAARQGLTGSPPGTLDADTSGYVDYLDVSGRPLEPATQRNAVFVRRWSIDPLPGSPRQTMVLQVRVVPWPTSRRAAGEAAQLVAVAGGNR